MALNGSTDDLCYCLYKSTKYWVPLKHAWYFCTLPAAYRQPPTGSGYWRGGTDSGQHASSDIPYINSNLSAMNPKAPTLIHQKAINDSELR